MSTSGFTTIQCPNCQRSLPPNAQHCHFCGASLAGVARPIAAPKAPKYRKGVEPWVMTLFYIAASYWILEGLFFLGLGLIAMILPDAQSIAPLNLVIGGGFMAIGAFIALIGLGLLMKWEWCRGVANVFCWIRIVVGFWRLKNIITMGLFFQRSGIFIDFMFAIVGIAVAGLQVWLLSETD